MFPPRYKSFTGLLLLLSWTSVAGALSIPPAYQQIAQAEAVPADIWFALLQQESCIPLKNTSHCLPWPWTLNIDGHGYYLPSQSAAKRLLNQALEQRLPVAVGAGQIYWPAHHGQFENAAELLDIATNLHYSARWLRRQFDHCRDWWCAVGRYHAPNRPEAAQRYRRRVLERWEKLHE